MFIVEAIADFSSKVMQPPQTDKQKDQQQKQNSDEQQQLGQKKQKENSQSQDKQQNALISKKRQRDQKHNEQLNKQAEEQNENQHIQKQTQNSNQVKYTQFKIGDKILVKQTYQNGWWLGHPVGKVDLQGFFPSNYVQVGIKPPAPPPPSKKPKQSEEQIPQFDPNEGTDWIKKQLDQMNQTKSGPVKSDYYQGIKGYKMVKIDQKNQNILKGNHVQFDVNTGLARVPVKDQAPAAKAVRQMGYYFDYHQWNQGKNNNPQKKSRPDPKRKKQKRLNLKMMD